MPKCDECGRRRKWTNLRPDPRLLTGESLCFDCYGSAAIEVVERLTLDIEDTSLALRSVIGDKKSEVARSQMQYHIDAISL